jgi:hypothetical protein
MQQAGIETDKYDLKRALYRIQAFDICDLFARQGKNAVMSFVEEVMKRNVSIKNICKKYKENTFAYGVLR